MNLFQVLQAISENWKQETGSQLKAGPGALIGGWGQCPFRGDLWGIRLGSPRHQGPRPRARTVLARLMRGWLCPSRSASSFVTLLGEKGPRCPWRNRSEVEQLVHSWSWRSQRPVQALGPLLGDPRLQPLGASFWPRIWEASGSALPPGTALPPGLCFLGDGLGPWCPGDGGAGPPEQGRGVTGVKG